VKHPPSGLGVALLLLGSLLLAAGVLALILLPVLGCPECGGFGEVQYIHSTTGAKAQCPRCDGDGRVDLHRYLPALDPSFH
jgi:hypothetical protein